MLTKKTKQRTQVQMLCIDELVPQDYILRDDRRFLLPGLAEGVVEGVLTEHVRPKQRVDVAHEPASGG